MFPKRMNQITDPLIVILPNDVVIEILVRLPVKSLLKLKCLSKLWNHFISSRNFSKTYLRYSKPQHCLILSNRREQFNHFTFPCMLLTEPPEPLLFDANHVVDNFTDYLFVGMCNGLVCIEASTDNPAFTRNHIVLWNPSTREAKRLPDFGEEPGYGKLRSHGFGFDESCDDYKVVAYYFGCTNKFDVLVKIFSLKTGVLKRIKNHCGRWIIMRPPCFVRGKLYWIAETKPDHHIFIAYLDLMTEEYGVVDKPDCVVLTHSFVKPVTREALYVICHGTARVNVTNVWLVEPSSGIGKTTWTKVYSISGNSDPGAFWRYETFLFVLDNGEIVFLDKGKIEIFKPGD